MDRHGVAWHEKTLGQLFCDDSAKDIINLLLAEMKAARVQLRLGTAVAKVSRTATGFELALPGGTVACSSLVVASGGKSIPKMGATGWGYEIAAQFGLPLIETRPALVPLTFEVGALERLKPLAGVAVDAVVACGKTKFAEAMLFTHRGLSGPAILQISSYWQPGQPLRINLVPGVNIADALIERKATSKQHVQNLLSQWLPTRLADAAAERAGVLGRGVAQVSDKALRALGESLNRWELTPSGTEGFKKAEVTRGGVDTRLLDSRTMMAKSVPGLYFIGEVVDVTGWLGGYNFQWAWASGYACALALAEGD